MIRSRGANLDDILRYYYEMGYFRGRADALDGRPYDARLPNERPIPTPSSASSSEEQRPDARWAGPPSPGA